MANSVDAAILCQIHVIKKTVYHRENNYHFHSDVNYIYYQSEVKQSKSIMKPNIIFF